MRKFEICIGLECLAIGNMLEKLHNSFHISGRSLPEESLPTKS